MAACARADGSERRRILAMHPGIFHRLSGPQLLQPPNLTESGNHEAWARIYRDPSEGDWAGCARALVEHGMPIPDSSERYSPDVAAYFASVKLGTESNFGE